MQETHLQNILGTSLCSSVEGRSEPERGRDGMRARARREKGLVKTQRWRSQRKWKKIERRRERWRRWRRGSEEAQAAEGPRQRGRALRDETGALYLVQCLSGTDDNNNTTTITTGENIRRPQQNTGEENFNVLPVLSNLTYTRVLFPASPIFSSILSSLILSYTSSPLCSPLS